MYDMNDDFKSEVKKELDSKVFNLAIPFDEEQKRIAEIEKLVTESKEEDVTKWCDEKAPACYYLSGEASMEEILDMTISGHGISEIDTVEADNMLSLLLYFQDLKDKDQLKRLRLIVLDGSYSWCLEADKYMKDQFDYSIENTVPMKLYADIVEREFPELLEKTMIFANDNTREKMNIDEAYMETKGINVPDLDSNYMDFISREEKILQKQRY